jgi:hypothetical protein
MQKVSASLRKEANQRVVRFQFSPEILTARNNGLGEAVEARIESKWDGFDVWW